MSAAELMVAVVGLVAGYWLVSFLMSGRAAAPSSTPAEPAPSSPQEPPDAADWPQVLELPADASVDDIEQRARERLAQYAPDRVANLGPELQALARRKTQEIEHARALALAQRSHPR